MILYKQQIKGINKSEFIQSQFTRIYQENKSQISTKLKQK